MWDLSIYFNIHNFFDSKLKKIRYTFDALDIHVVQQIIYTLFRESLTTGYLIIFMYSYFRAFYHYEYLKVIMPAFRKFKRVLANPICLNRARRQLELDQARFWNSLLHNDVQLSKTCTLNENCVELRKLSQIIFWLGYCGRYPSSVGSIKI